ncbi:MAG TPA: hypothetical protein DHM37_06620 [Candidatus Cloacimonas sp.]|jgi:hypothetical protein|nr:hypothetical protein [Candidatus Cloacimonas sp.]
MKKNNYYLGLVHHPVYNKRQEIITTSITNLDIHDIARSCLTYGVKNYFVINPLSTQEKMLQSILKFWQSDLAEKYNPDRVSALSIINYQPAIETAKEYIKNQEGIYPVVVTTTALERENQSDFEEFKQLELTRPVLILFGTGNGLVEQLHREADYILTPIRAKSSYNHLSVRSAVAIVLDRLTSEK